MLWYVGALLALASCLFSAGGLTLQRLSYLLVDTKDKDQKQRWMLRPVNLFWLCGVAMYMIAAPLDVISVLTTTLTVAASVNALQLVLIAFFAWMWLDVEITANCGLGILLCIAGATVTMIAAPKTDMVQLNTPLDFFVPQNIGYLIFSGCAVLLLGGCSSFYRSAPAFALVIAWVYSVEKMFNSAMRTVAHGPLVSFTELRWVWLPLTVGVLGLVSMGLNLVAVRLHSTHTLVPMIAGCTTVVQGVQSVLLGEIREFDAASRVWLGGVLLSVIGTLVVRRADIEETEAERQALLPKRQYWPQPERVV